MVLQKNIKKIYREDLRLFPSKYVSFCGCNSGTRRKSAQRFEESSGRGIEFVSDASGHFLCVEVEYYCI